MPEESAKGLQRVSGREVCGGACPQAMEQPQHARQRRFPRNGGQGEMRLPFFWSSATEGVPGKPFPVPHGGCPEDWGLDVARPRQRIALLGRKKARNNLNTRDSAGSPVMGVRGKCDFRFSGAQRQKGSRGNLSPCPMGAVRRTGG